MKKYYNEFVIGISVTLAILIVIVGIMWLEKSNIFAKGLTLHVIVRDAKGLSVGDEVLYRGLAIGTVQKAHIAGDGISITLKIKDNVKIPSDSKFIIKEISLLGEKAMVIMPGQAKTFLKNNQIINGIPEESIMEMAENSKMITHNLSQILTNLDSISNPTNRQIITESLLQLHDLLSRSNALLKNSAPHLQGTLKDLHELTAENKSAIDTLLQALGTKSSHLKESLMAINRISKRTDALLAKIEQGKGTMGKLIKDDSLYQNLNRTILHLDSLILSIRKNPKKFFEVKVF